tara:strand:- start:134 stop:1105 length:972 start_codon:yes stop_codon:yes gene_type:complete
MYDASTSAAEAITCAVRVKSKKVEMPNTVYVSELVPPHRMSVIENYTQGVGIEIRKIPHNEDGFLDLEAASDAKGSCAIYVEQPNAFGILDEGLLRLRDTVGEKTAIIVGVDVTSLGLVEPPGNWGADIVVGEGQPFGIGPTAGGPIYGIFACKKDFLRLMPGRIVGQSIDTVGKTAYTLTLSTREQHIRRHRATSNICSNETLIALMGAMHMALLGPVGLETLSTRILSSTRMAIDELSSLEGLEFAFPKSPVFREFAVKVPGKSSEALSHIFELGVIGGFDISQWWPEKESWILIGCDERTSESDISSLKKSLSSWVEASS